MKTWNEIRKAATAFSKPVETVNKISDTDTAGGWLGKLDLYQYGSYDLIIPVYWFSINEPYPTGKLFCRDLQRLTVLENGTMKILKFGKEIERPLYMEGWE